MKIEGKRERGESSEISFSLSKEMKKRKKRMRERRGEEGMKTERLKANLPSLQNKQIEYRYSRCALLCAQIMSGV